MDVIYVNVDGTDFHVLEPFSFDTIYYSHELNLAGLRYEVDVSLDSKFVLFNGPFQSGLYNEIYIFRLNLKRDLGSRESSITGEGYSDESCASPNKIMR